MVDEASSVTIHGSIHHIVVIYPEHVTADTLTGGTETTLASSRETPKSLQELLVIKQQEHNCYLSYHTLRISRQTKSISANAFIFTST